MLISNIPQIKALLIFWSYVKKYAWIFFAVISGVLAYMLFRKSDPTQLFEHLDAIQKRHADEIKAIQDANTKNESDRAANEKKLQKALELLDERYKQQLIELDQQKKVEIDKILSESNGDPQILADALAKQLDLQVKSQ